MVIASRARCTKPFVQTAARNVKCLLSPSRAGQFTAMNVMRSTGRSAATAVAAATAATDTAEAPGVAVTTAAAPEAGGTAAAPGVAEEADTDCEKGRALFI